MEENFKEEEIIMADGKVENLNDHSISTIKRYTKLLDLNRGQHIKEYVPELEKFIYG